jgi:hypothetical protein
MPRRNDQQDDPFMQLLCEALLELMREELENTFHSQPRPGCPPAGPTSKS